jgi:hypothetical protein
LRFRAAYRGKAVDDRVLAGARIDGAVSAAADRVDTLALGHRDGHLPPPVDVT